MRETDHGEKAGLFRLMALPHIALLVGTLLSFAAWALPALSEVGKGFVPPPTDTSEVVRTLLAYAAIAAAAAVGFYVGIPLGRRLPAMASRQGCELRSTTVWTAWILIGGIGALFVLAKVIGAMGIGGCINAITHFNANSIKAVLYTDYSIGILSLRYVAILAGAIAIFRYLAYREFSLRTIVASALLISIALVSSRLALIWAVIIGGTTYLLAPAEIGKRRIRFHEVSIGLALLVVALGALTISRTFGFYREHGATTFTSAAGSEFQRYLAAPFQGSIEAVNYPERGARLANTAGIASELTTNSAFLQMASTIGRWNVLGIAAAVFWSGFVCGLLLQFRGTYFIVILGILQCCHLEMWRIFMFAQGLTLTVLFFAFSVPMFFAVFRLPEVKFPVIVIRLSRSA